jgi:hypothetical protein
MNIQFNNPTFDESNSNLLYSNVEYNELTCRNLEEITFNISNKIIKYNDLYELYPNNKNKFRIKTEYIKDCYINEILCSEHFIYDINILNYFANVNYETVKQYSMLKYLCECPQSEIIKNNLQQDKYTENNINSICIGYTKSNLCYTYEKFLNDFINGNNKSNGFINTILYIIISVIDNILLLHCDHILHLNINPSNILINFSPINSDFDSDSDSIYNLNIGTISLPKLDTEFDKALDYEINRIINLEKNNNNDNYYDYLRKEFKISINEYQNYKELKKFNEETQFKFDYILLNDFGLAMKVNNYNNTFEFDTITGKKLSFECNSISPKDLKKINLKNEYSVFCNEPSVTKNNECINYYGNKTFTKDRDIDLILKLIQYSYYVINMSEYNIDKTDTYKREKINKLGAIYNNYTKANKDYYILDPNTFGYDLEGYNMQSPNFNQRIKNINEMLNKMDGNKLNNNKKLVFLRGLVLSILVE